MDSCYEYDKASGHFFCKSCGNNYLLDKHKENCDYVKSIDKEINESTLWNLYQENKQLKAQVEHWKDIAEQWRIEYSRKINSQSQNTKK